jgi:hypothetical protein
MYRYFDVGQCALQNTVLDKSESHPLKEELKTPPALVLFIISFWSTSCSLSVKSAWSNL